MQSTESWPAGGLESVPHCPICGDSARETVHLELSDRIFFCAPGTWNLYRCTGCATGYLDPRPTEDTISLAYDSYYTHAAAAKVDVDQLSLARKVRRSLANGYRNHQFGTQDLPANPLGVLSAKLLAKQRATMDTESRHIPKPTPGARLLDIGCGDGNFLEFARRAGWTVVGVDFDEKAVEAARSRGLDIRHGGVEVLDPAERFDGITLSHVIEHVHDPVALLAACRRMLNPGGWIWLETPNLDALGHQRYGADWRGLEPPRHLVLFTPASLKQALAKAGFVDAEIQRAALSTGFTFSASEAIARGEGSMTENDYLEEAGALIKAAEREATRNPDVREFITIKAWRAA
ncbi:hypothetical protein Lfu02_19980 [Longispora fulva]|uniref:2-polyprenyl-3-methyl-5-hydroxy-6-metoxy-1, 4-benzoquinol methylase n=1 Tax=Longispora fulva TaxID=619741 RepID=A0A8J7KJ35_9ACTN|nr:class I SAM-dependent methyltransferase [Longispora fulva]MBG6139995.1 2-polyprenyl-3-methyl-5-hydroxy-6-metoxy-1,4-benzoquinol methylase [Longispora fulva]GIG57626.1 hypothetical protein Lfu02_19980 [Longispora fulva]